MRNNPLIPKSKLPNLGTTIFTQMSALAQKHQAINLSQGFPDFDGPRYLHERLAYHVAQGANQYAPMTGAQALREAIADKTAEIYGYRPDDVSDITVTAGATEALYAAITALVRAGDEVICFDPSYDSYAPAVALSGGVLKRIALTPPHFRVDWQAFSALLSERTRLVILNTPHNPTATVWRQADIEALWQAIGEREIYVLSDEVYEHICFAVEGHASVLAHLAQAQGQLAKDNATLANARRDLARYQQLAKTNLVSRQELDAQQALVNETQGTIKADEANVASAQLQLDWSRITAPVSGRVGLKQVDVGNQISSSDTAGIVVITQTHPIDLIFTLPESDIATVVQAQKAGKALVVEAWDRTNSHKLSEGVLLSLDNQIDPTTGTIKIKARFTNQDDTLFPNQFVNARMLVDTEQNAVVVPAAAVQMGNEGHFVWVLNDENNVSKKRVKIGIQDNQNVVISAGLSAGDRVVTDGIDRLTEGAKVEVVEPQTTVADEKSPSRHEGQKGARA